MKPLFKNKNDLTIMDGTTSIVVQPYNLGDIPHLEYRLTTYNDIYHRIELVGIDYDIPTKRLFLPKSISVPMLEKNYHDRDVKVKSLPIDPKSRVTFGMKYPPRDDTQIRAIDFLVGRDKYTTNIYYPRLLFSLDTGKGKTYCTLNAISQLGYRSAIIVPDTTLIDRWVSEIYKMTDITKDEIFILKGFNSVKKLKKKVKGKKIILISHRTISNIGNNMGWDFVSNIFKCLKIGIKVYDEAHKEFRNIIKIDLHTSTQKSFYLTATAGRSVLKENKIFKDIFANIPKMVTYVEQRSDNHINTLILRYTSKPTYNEKIKCKTRKGFSSAKYMDYNMHTGRLHFQAALQVILNTILSNHDDGRIMLMLGSINMIYMIEGFIKETYPSLKDDIGIYCSAVSTNVKKITKDEKRIILTTFKSLGTGADVDGLKYVVMTEPYSSKLTASQAPGRLREEGWYFELVDIGFQDCDRQFESRKKTLIKKSNKFKIVNM